ncbi:D-alanyl-lipoteichoic acid biosynthesis protein DltB [Streptococcus plurextorum]|uniref:D-alanyl-lipoteichoic acid biosynthesis protein DltB n=1 Tax=Streptococcus plurextorum TaxID=456876 RepID=UPI000423AFCB|nr:D-alanyl-lipoteichoic acid biosynthesis protein DltB [Streptococcus plurextorum]
MMSFASTWPHLEVYGNPLYFLYLIVAVSPIFIGLFFKKRFPIYESLVSLLFIVLMLTGTDLKQVTAFVLYVVWQVILVYSYKCYRKHQDSKWVFYLASFLAVFPLILVKVSPLIPNGQDVSLFSFLGISYLTFRSVGMIIEMRDGVLTEFSLWQMLRFVLFMPTFSGGPIDRFKRFDENYKTIPDRAVLMDMLEQSVSYLMRGFLYKFILAYFLGEVLLKPLQEMAISRGGFFNLPTLGVMYLYGLYLFFDFAGYSLFALSMSNLMGITSQPNFDQPFKSRDLKEFWNRWHMSLSFWFRDFVFMRLVKVMVKNKVFSNRNTTSSVAYLINMLVMGFWHGITWYYIAYGLFHGLGLVINDWWIRKKKTINKERKARNLAPLPDNKWTRVVSIIFTFHVVMASLLLFSGFLDKLWFSKP